MEPIPESKTLEEVRRWRKEAYEEALRQTPAQREEEARRLADQLGLKTVPESELVKPRQDRWPKRAG